MLRAGELVVGGFSTSDDGLFADDFVFHYFNRELPDLAGDYRGVDGIRGFFEQLHARSAGTFRVEPISLTPFGDELVVAHATVTVTVDDTARELDALVVWRVFGGQIHEAWDIPAVNTTRTPE